jgi:hypothetical protein
MQQEPTPVDDSQPVLSASKEDLLQVFGATLAKTRDKWIRARAATGWDKKASKALDQYHGIDAANRMASSMMDSVQQGFPVTVREARPTRSTVFVGITRQKTNAAEARLGDILLPTDDKNWGIQPTPDPECARALKDGTQLIDPATGQPVLIDQDGNITDDPSVGRPITKKDIAVATQQMAKQAASAMEREIEDQLIECEYNSELRKMIHDAAVMGVGVICGPLVTKRTRKAWREKADPDGSKVQVLEVVEELRPASFRKDPRFVWEDPACGDDIQNGAGVFEMESMTEKKVRDLAKQPGYMIPQLKAVLEEGPKTSAALYDLERDKDGLEENKTFKHWTYWGELRAEDLKAAGLEVSEDELASYSGCVEMINDTVIRAYLNPLEDGAIPYDFYPWEKVQGQVRGVGIPELMSAQQSVTNAAWRQMMDNSGVTSGPQIIMRRGAVTPADGQMALTPRKFWWLNEDVADATKVFHTVEFESHQRELAGIIDLAEKLADQETATPMMAQAQQGSAPETVGGMQLLMNSANVVLRRLVKQFDDYVTRRHIRRYYDYNMAYSEDDDIKGDFQIDARGSSALITRDVQNQAYTNLLAAAANPVFAPMIDAKKLFEKALQAQHVDPKDIMLSDEKIEANKQNAGKQVDPKVQAAQIAAQARVEEANAIAQGRQQETAARMEQEVEDRRLRELELQLNHDLQIMKTASAEKITIDQVKAALAQTAIADRTKKELAASEMLFKEHSPDHKGI